MCKRYKRGVFVILLQTRYYKTGHEITIKCGYCQGPFLAEIQVEENLSLVKVHVWLTIKPKMCVLPMLLQDDPSASTSSKSQSSTGGDGTTANRSKLVRNEKSRRSTVPHQ
ncbi:unnamed protein product [Cylicocyclus nassatus]|uniref:Uncharacterized protein n=1 Tax=Cylicocyclus nassatus TaxID=53992 RepID=A0AA36HE63_CYLNA|nr:unnamed protein product [Cylicocyclus nassatus]